MGILNINDLKAGMVLAQAALNKHGTVILGEGSVLTEKHINFFKSWGIPEVDIQGVDSDQLVQEEMAALSGDTVELIEQQLDALFPSCEAHPVMEEIYKIVKKIRLRQAATRANGVADETTEH